MLERVSTYFEKENRDRRRIIYNYRLLTSGDATAATASLYSTVFNIKSQHNLRQFNRPDFVKVHNLSFFLEHIGLDPDKTVHAWEKSYSSMSWDTPEGLKELNTQYATNILNICRLESERPGSARVFTEEFDIRAFHRYAFSDNVSHLTDQYDQRDDKTTPYGVVAVARDDHKYSFHSLSSLLTNVKEELGDSHIIRVIEVDGARSLLAGLNKIHRRYGTEGNKISFGILAGHGNQNGVILGGQEKTDPFFVVTSDLFQNDTLKKGVRNFFTDDATIIFHSCSTGKDDGIAQKVAHALDVTTVAPEGVTERPKIHVANTRGSLVFDATYDEGIQTRRYTA